MSNGSPERGHRPPRRQTRFLKRQIVSADDHCFMGRIYKLGMVTFHFDSYNALAGYPDCKYAVDTADAVRMLTGRVETLNLVGDMLWPDPLPTTFKEMPISRYDWLTVVVDAFLARYASVADCAMVLTNEVFQLGLALRDCKINSISRSPLPPELIALFHTIIDDQELVRTERNARFHHGKERRFTDDDATFKFASNWIDKGPGLRGNDQWGRPINVDIAFKEGLVRLQREFNNHVVLLQAQLDRLYDILWDEFEDRWGRLVASATHGLNGLSTTPRRIDAPLITE